MLIVCVMSIIVFRIWIRIFISTISQCICALQKKSESFIFLFISVEMECGRRHGGRWLQMVWGIYFFFVRMERKFFFSEMYGTRIVNTYILFGNVLHIQYTGTRVICMYECRKKNGKAQTQCVESLIFRREHYCMGGKLFFFCDVRFSVRSKDFLFRLQN